MSTPRTTAASSKASSTKDEVGALLHEAALEEDITDEERKEIMMLALQQQDERTQAYYGNSEPEHVEHVPLYKKFLRGLGNLCGGGSGVDCDDSDSEYEQNEYDRQYEQQYAGCTALGEEMIQAEEWFATRDSKYTKDPLYGKYSVPRPCFYDWNRLSSCDDCDPTTVVNPETDNEKEMRRWYNKVKGSHFGKIGRKERKYLRAACVEGMSERNEMIHRGAYLSDIKKWCGVQHRKKRKDRESRRELSYIHDKLTKEFWDKVDP